MQAVAGLFGPKFLVRFDEDNIATGLADDYGMDQTAIRDDAEVQKILEAMAKQQAAQANAQMAQALLSNADKVASLAPLAQSGALGGAQ